MTTLDEFYKQLEVEIYNRTGFTSNEPWDYVVYFEKLVADFTGAPYAVSTDTCTNSMFMCMKMLAQQDDVEIVIPTRTYLSVPQAILHAGYRFRFEDYEWQGLYDLKPLKIIDCATRFRKGMYVPGNLQCLSFHKKKVLNLGKGGMILTDNADHAEWLRKMRYEGRDLSVLYQYDNIKMNGWNFYMSPEQAMMGTIKFLDVKDTLTDENSDCGGSWRYKDLREHDLFKEWK